jgi:hypothetical protein
VFVRTSPRKEGRYRFQTTYEPRPRATLGGSVNILQQSNADAQTQFVGHNQNYGLPRRSRRANASVWTWRTTSNSAIQNALICFNDWPPAGVILPFVANAVNNNCTGNDTANNLMANSYYTNHTNFGMTTIRFKPTKERRSTSATGSPALMATCRNLTFCRQVPAA